MAQGGNYSFGRGPARPETKAERRERAKHRAAQARLAIARASEDRKIELLGEAIADAFVKRGQVALHDLTQAGFAEAEAKRLYDAALAHAQSIEPSMRGIAA